MNAEQGCYVYGITWAEGAVGLDDVQGIGDADISRIGEQIRARLDRADAEVEVKATGLEAQMDDVLGKERLVDQLAERKRRLGMGGQS